VRPGGIILWHDFCPDMYGKSETVTGVMDAVAELRDGLDSQVERLFWIRPSYILVAVKGQA